MQGLPWSTADVHLLAGACMAGSQRACHQPAERDHVPRSHSPQSALMQQPASARPAACMWQGSEPGSQPQLPQPDSPPPAPGTEPAAPAAQQDWEELPCGLPALTVPMARPALADQLPQPGRRLSRAAAAAAAARPSNPYDFIKPAVKQPPRSAADVTRIFVGLAGTGKQVAHHHTTHPGWRVIVQALNAQVEGGQVSAEQAVSIVSAAGLIGAGPATNTIIHRTAVQLANVINDQRATFPASACASFLRGLDVTEASPEAWQVAGSAFLGTWVSTLWDAKTENLRSLPAECLGALEVCAQYQARPGDFILGKLAVYAVNILERGQEKISIKVGAWLGPGCHAWRL